MATLGESATPTQIAAYLASVRDDVLASVTTMPRQLVQSTVAGMASQSLRLTGFTADKSLTANNVATLSGITAAAATPTVCRIGVYSVSVTNDCTLIGSTANDTTLWAAAATRYIKALSAPTSIVQGQRYAVGILVVTAAAMPNFYGSSSIPGAESLIAPFVSAALASQSDLPSTIAGTSLAASGTGIYARLTI